jgi:PDZ domain-containing protein
MKQIIKRYKWHWLTQLVVLVAVLIISLWPVSYRIVAPGYNDEVGDFIWLDEPYESRGSFHTTSVIVLNRTSLLQKIVGDWEWKVDLSEQPDFFQEIDIDDLTISGYLSKDDSLNNSLVVGILESGYQIDYRIEHMVYLTYSFLEEDTIELGDVLLDINGNTDYTEEVNNVVCGESAMFHVLRDGEELYFQIEKKKRQDGSCLFGLSIRPFTEIIDSEIDYKLIDTNTGGGSGGLMQALYVYDRLTETDLTGGKKIAGTGTIDVNGNVGPIGGIEQKIITSVMNGMDVFFVPHLSDDPNDNYVRASEILAKLETDMVLVPVQSFSDALHYLQTHNEEG